MRSDTSIRLTRSDAKGTYKVDILTISRILGDFRSYRFFDDKTGSEHFQGMVLNIFISKSMTRLRFMPILIWFNENLFFVRSTCASYQRCWSRTDVSRQNTIWNIVKLCCPHKISRNGKVIFGYFLLIRNLFMNTIWSHSSLISFFVINPEDGIFRVWVLNFRK